MSTVSDLKDYCNIENPVGALLLTGEWGCGKTYLVEHTLKEELKDSHVIIRVSLFGITSVDQIHASLKKEWFNETVINTDKVSGLSKLKKPIEKLSDLIPKKGAKTVLDAVFSIDWLEFVKIEKKIGNKTVVLVFDDLERSNLNNREKLGTINEYCENRGFNVIIIADEERLEEDFKEIKEKVVQRTVHHEVDYKEVVKSVISSEPDNEYRKLLSDHYEIIANLFAGKNSEGNSLNEESYKKIENYRRLNIIDETDSEHKKEFIKSRPHNLRSLKAAIQDFKRVYSILKTQNAEDIQKWLYTFIAYSLAAKANIVNYNEHYGMAFGENTVSIMYPGYFDSRLMPESLSSWIVKGVWDEDTITQSISRLYSVTPDSPPKEQVKRDRIDFLEEEVAIQGMKDILQEVYDGNLSFNDYVMFIINSRFVRLYNLFDLKIDWDQVFNGIKKKSEDIQKTDGKSEKLRRIISDLDGFEENEKKAYLMVIEAYNNSVERYDANRLDYIEIMCNGDPDLVFAKLSDRRFNCFDYEMAMATLEGYKRADNYSKAQFSKCFKRMWENFKSSNDIKGEKIEEAITNFCVLKQKLSELCIQYDEYPFKKRFTESFVSAIDELTSDGQARKQ